VLERASGSPTRTAAWAAAQGADEPGKGVPRVDKRRCQICNAAAMGSASDRISNGARSVTASTVCGHESVIQKNLRYRETGQYQRGCVLQCVVGGGGRVEKGIPRSADRAAAASWLLRGSLRAAAARLALPAPQPPAHLKPSAPSPSVGTKRFHDCCGKTPWVA
jgi:hypothetical protein